MKQSTIAAIVQAVKPNHPQILPPVSRLTQQQQLLTRHISVEIKNKLKTNPCKYNKNNIPRMSVCLSICQMLFKLLAIDHTFLNLPD
jgi:hypothetical protein